jgi:hypothetical protein
MDIRTDIHEGQIARLLRLFQLFEQFSKAGPYDAEFVDRITDFILKNKKYEAEIAWLQEYCKVISN